MIVATPLNLPTIEPDSWDVFWNIWNTHAADLIKVKMNSGSPVPVGTQTLWKGIDVFKSPKGHDMCWTAPFYDISKDLPVMSEMIKQLPLAVERVRIIQSVGDIPAHRDYVNGWHIRAMFHYTDSKQQWFFTKPGKPTERIFLKMPSDTNWFSYNDEHCWHGSIYNEQHQKLLIQLYLLNKNNKDTLIQHSIDKYNNYTVQL